MRLLIATLLMMTFNAFANDCHLETRINRETVSLELWEVCGDEDLSIEEIIFPDTDINFDETRF